jgi:hypothetical protein
MAWCKNFRGGGAHENRNGRKYMSRAASQANSPLTVKVGIETHGRVCHPPAARHERQVVVPVAAWEALGHARRPTLLKPKGGAPLGVG